MGMQGKVEICGVNTSKLKVLKSEETMELLKRARGGDMEAREQLIAQSAPGALGDPEVHQPR